MSARSVERAETEALLVTAKGYEQLRSELETLRTDGRRRMSERLREAREDDHLADNPALYDVFVEQAQLERRIASLEARVASARIVAPAADGIAGIGSRVRVRDVAVGAVAEYALVGATESDAGNGRVSVSAPLGRALVGQGPGESVEVETPRGTLSFEILSVRAQPAPRKAA
ncbi:MAG: GreA/GreB family elongation factor [Gaiellaceae bacterium]